MKLLQQMLLFLVVLLWGYYLCRKKVLDDRTNKSIAKIIVDYSNPALVLSASMSANIQLSPVQIAQVLGLVGLYYFILIGLVQFLPRLLHARRADYGTYRCMLIFSNVGFMGLPLVSALYGSKALLYASLFQIPYDCLIYTYGIATLQNGQKDERVSFKPSAILNNGVFACILALGINVAGIHLPGVVQSSLELVGNLTGPLSMMLVGASLAAVDLRELFTDVRLLGFTVVKLCVLPLFFIAALRYTNMDRAFLQACVIMVSTPVGSMVAMFAQLYNGDYRFAAKGVSLTTVLSVLTMPALAYFSGLFLF